MFGFMRQSAPALPLTEAISQVASGEMILVDIRDHNELTQTGKADGALHIPLMRLSMVADPRHPDFHPDLDLTKPIGLYCASGARSAMAVNVMRKLGYENVHNLGGLSHWVAAGGCCVPK
ncbi:rhodanese-like domain-containing protein [Thalassovita taeanensis]|uniref:Rhodanese-related sulfurtransferase n=1 Tax=Thalassovita taeanensis TaxID=657014 RepID=A0A1H8YU67_9RHOB|nr:rhodanese-like domain-containing protein [Thalassovita taeanensis]SEP55633.1 Rhodanese-related sulfurtransferase [Thalassovita taeanensis]